MSKTDQIERDIERTRHEMDETLDEVEERAQPRHLLDDVLEMFRSDSSDGRASDSVRNIGKSVVRQVKEHPVPALLCGAGLAWLALESTEGEEKAEKGRYRDWRHLPEHSGSYVDASTGQPYDGRYAVSAAWEEGYDWSEEDESSWLQQAREASGKIQKTLSDNGKSVGERLSSAASHLRSLRGGKYEEARGQWRNLPEHSGSVVDARSGEPYDEHYGEPFHPAEDLDYLSDHQWSEEEQGTWSEKGQRAIENMQRTLSNGQQSTQRRIKSLASQLSHVAGDVQGRAGSAGRRIRGGARQAGESARDYARQVQHRGAQAARSGQDQFSHAVQEYPLAVGAACLGLGLAVGLVLPASRQEDRWMGETSDDVKEQAKGTAQDAARRGQDVVQETGKAAIDEAERQGLTPEQIGEEVREGTSRVAETAREEAQQKGKDLGEKAERVTERAAETAKSRAKQEKETVSG